MRETTESRLAAILRWGQPERRARRSEPDWQPAPYRDLKVVKKYFRGDLACGVSWRVSQAYPLSVGVNRRNGVKKSRAKVGRVRSRSQRQELRIADCQLPIGDLNATANGSGNWAAGLLTAKLASQARHNMDAPNGLFASRIVVANHANGGGAPGGRALPVE